MYEAKFYRQISETNKVECYLCAHNCHIKLDKRGICGVRENQKGILYALAYGKLVAVHVDPIEKKPLFHFQPGSLSLSIASQNCNLQCQWCQNYQISQNQGYNIEGEFFAPSFIVKEAIKQKCKSISYTYTEPIIHFEYNFDCGIKAHEKGIKNVFVSNGTFTKQSALEAVKFLDAINIDLKSMSHDVYQKLCKGDLKSVLDSIEILWKNNVWVEITTLIIPTINDSDEELIKAARFIASVGKDIPWHLSRFHPDYKIDNLPQTPIATLRKAKEIGKAEGLNFVYTGNVWGDDGENSYCPGCGNILIERYGFSSKFKGLKDGKCNSCNKSIPGVDLT